MAKEEDEGGPQSEHDHRVPEQPVGQPATARQLEVFGHRQGLDIANASPVEISGGRVMDGMGAAPVVVWRQGDHGDGSADPIVEHLAGREGAVSAIVLDDEQADQEPGGRDREDQAPPDAMFQREPGPRPEDGEGNRRQSQLHRAADRIGQPIRPQESPPVAPLDRSAHAEPIPIIVQDTS